MNGWAIGGRQIKVGRAISSTGLTLVPPTMLTPPSVLPTTATTATPDMSALAHFVAKQEDPLAREESLSINTPYKRFEIMQKLARSTDIFKTSRCIVLRNMVGVEDVDDDLQHEVTDECSKHGPVDKVVIYQEKQSERPGDIIVKIFVAFQRVGGALHTQHTTHNTQNTTHNTQHTKHNTQHTTQTTHHTKHNQQQKPDHTKHRKQTTKQYPHKTTNSKNRNARKNSKYIEQN
eukprot:TRINITY_DN1267_c2_g1_i1.p1 TRINITY_DN1267_c2_g1~~TRINITY_DN1267_c2_g1_i1.p1  ORF type:complete len:233 (+),score=58.39 TRINITY_DN1267_c2_g1_i1:695-1393(+)